MIILLIIFGGYPARACASRFIVSLAFAADDWSIVIVASFESLLIADLSAGPSVLSTFWALSSD